MLVNHVLVEGDVLTRMGEAGIRGNVFHQFSTRTGGGLAIVDTSDGFGEAIEAEAAKRRVDGNRGPIRRDVVLVLLDGDFLGKLRGQPYLDLHMADKIPAVEPDVECRGAEGPDVIVLAGRVGKEGVPRFRGLEGLSDGTNVKVVEDSVEVDHQNVLIGGVVGVDVLQQSVAHEGEAHGAGGNGIGFGVERQNAVAVGVGLSERFQNGLGAVGRAILGNDNRGLAPEGGDFLHSGQGLGEFVGDASSRSDEDAGGGFHLGRDGGDCLGRNRPILNLTHRCLCRS